MSSPVPTRLLAYSTGSRGLGSAQRTLRVLSYLQAQSGRCATKSLLIGAQPGLRKLADGTGVATPGVALLTELAVLKRDQSGNGGSDLETAVASLSESLIDLVDAFAPQIFMSTSPHGVAGELQLPLRTMRDAQCRSVLVLRDIYAPRRPTSGLDRLSSDDYDLVIVGAPREHSGWIRPLLVGGISSVAIQYVGYLRPLDRSMPTPDLDPRASPLIVCQVGGGDDGMEIFAATVEAARRLRRCGFPSLSLLLVAGPRTDVRGLLRLQLTDENWIEVTDWLHEPQAFARTGPSSTVIVSRAGYNSCTEAAWHGVPTVLCPRIEKNEWEQEIRARLFAEAFANISCVERISANRLAAHIADSFAMAAPVPRSNEDWFAQPGDVASLVLG